MESPWKGLSDMDVARAAMGQGWPFVGGPHPVVPLERWWSEGTPAQQGGGASLVCRGVFLRLLSLHKQRNVAKRSNSRRLARRVSVASQVSRP